MLEGPVKKKEGHRDRWLPGVGKFNADGRFEYVVGSEKYVISGRAIARCSIRPGADPTEFEVITETRTVVFMAEASGGCTAQTMVRPFTPPLSRDSERML